jgi:hypothetical protein
MKSRKPLLVREAFVLYQLLSLGDPSRAQRERENLAWDILNLELRRNDLCERLWQLTAPIRRVVADGN